MAIRNCWRWLLPFLVAPFIASVAQAACPGFGVESVNIYGSLSGFHTISYSFTGGECGSVKTSFAAYAAATVHGSVQSSGPGATSVTAVETIDFADGEKLVVVASCPSDPWRSVVTCTPTNVQPSAGVYQADWAIGKFGVPFTAGMAWQIGQWVKEHKLNNAPALWAPLDDKSYAADAPLVVSAGTAQTKFHQLWGSSHSFPEQVALEWRRRHTFSNGLSAWAAIGTSLPKIDTGVTGQVQLEEGLWQLRARFDHPDYTETTSHEFWIGDPSDPTKPSPVIESPLAQGSYDAGAQSLHPVDFKMKAPEGGGLFIYWAWVDNPVAWELAMRQPNDEWSTITQFATNGPSTYTIHLNEAQFRVRARFDRPNHPWSAWREFGTGLSSKPAFEILEPSGQTISKAGLVDGTCCPLVVKRRDDSVNSKIRMQWSREAPGQDGSPIPQELPAVQVDLPPYAWPASGVISTNLFMLVYQAYLQLNWPQTIPLIEAGTYRVRVRPVEGGKWTEWRAFTVTAPDITKLLIKAKDLLDGSAIDAGQFLQIPGALEESGARTAPLKRLELRTPVAPTLPPKRLPAPQRPAPAQQAKPSRGPQTQPHQGAERTSPRS